METRRPVCFDDFGTSSVQARFASYGMIKTLPLVAGKSIRPFRATDSRSTESLFRPTFQILDQSPSANSDLGSPVPDENELENWWGWYSCRLSPVEAAEAIRGRTTEEKRRNHDHGEVAHAAQLLARFQPASDWAGEGWQPGHRLAVRFDRDVKPQLTLPAERLHVPSNHGRVRLQNQQVRRRLDHRFENRSRDAVSELLG